MAGAIPTVAVRQRRVWRCVPAAFANTVLESGPSFTKDRRYSIQGEFGAVYLSGARELSQLEAGARGGEELEPLAYMAFDLTVDKLVDLTSEKTRRHFKIQLEDLVRPRIANDRYVPTQALARQVYDHRLNGIIAPSVHDPHTQKSGWENIILYPARLMLYFCLSPVKEK